MPYHSVTTPGNCCACSGPLPIPRHARRIRCFACAAHPYIPKPSQAFAFPVFEDDWSAGVRAADIAAKYGVSLATIYHVAQAAGKKRVRTAHTHAPEVQHASDIRKQQMVDARAAGMTLVQIGEIHGLTRERVRQILSRLGLDSSNSGRKKVSDQRKQAKRVAVSARRDARCMRVYGCSFESLESILGKDVVLTSHRTARAYVQHKRNSGWRGIEFLLTFTQWWAVWQKSGKWKQRGRGQGYVMARTGDVGPYAVGNVYICTQSQNSKDSFLKTPASARAAKRAANPNAKGTLGSGKGWSFDKTCKSRPYRVVVRNRAIGAFATAEEARSAYLDAVGQEKAA